MKNIAQKLLILAMLTSLFSCKSADNNEFSKDSHPDASTTSTDASMYVQIKNRSFGQMIQIFQKAPDFNHIVVGKVINQIYFIDTYGQEQWLTQIQGESEIKLSPEQSDFDLSGPFYINGSYGSDGEKLTPSKRLIAVMGKDVGHVTDSATNTEYDVIFSCIPDPFVQKADGGFLIKGSSSFFNLVEETSMNEQDFRVLINNTIHNRLNMYSDACPDDSCENHCRTRDSDSSLSSAPSCAAEDGECFYGAVCTQVHLLAQPDPCPECGERDAGPAIIRRVIDGVEHCWDSSDYSEIECP